MDDKQLVTKFKITCLKCEEAKRKYETLLYVQWEKRYYMISCQTCDEMEAFDEFAKKIVIKEKGVKENEEESDETKNN